MTRARIRHVNHTITTHPDTVTYGADCLGCSWKIKGKSEPDSVLDACMQHAGISGHREFRTICQGLSYVLRSGER
ncbi:DUF7848 domain-containing protein [Streptomyces syringium]|uniref:DUF7848 domain-containing protein n=1 Tax=Streptomyces syringium TaxID=76729 RepID=UPI003F50F79F